MRYNFASVVACYFAAPFLLEALRVFVIQYDMQIKGAGLAYSLYGFLLNIEMQVILRFFVPEAR